MTEEEIAAHSAWVEQNNADLAALRQLPMQLSPQEMREQDKLLGLDEQAPVEVTE
jgi:hypothetical protein